MSPDYNPAMESMVGVEKRRSVDSILSTSSVVGDKYMRIPCTYIGSCDVPKPSGEPVIASLPGLSPRLLSLAV